MKMYVNGKRRRTHRASGVVRTRRSRSRKVRRGVGRRSHGLGKRSRRLGKSSYGKRSRRLGKRSRSFGKRSRSFGKRGRYSRSRLTHNKRKRGGGLIGNLFNKAKNSISGEMNCECRGKQCVCTNFEIEDIENKRVRIISKIIERIRKEISLPMDEFDSIIKFYQELIYNGIDENDLIRLNDERIESIKEGHKKKLLLQPNVGAQLIIDKLHKESKNKRLLNYMNEIGYVRTAQDI